VWTVALIAKEFGVLPSLVVRDLEEDPEGSAIECLGFLRYAQAKSAFDEAKSEKDLKPWKDSRMMDFVTKHTFDLKKERREKG